MKNDTMKRALAVIAAMLVVMGLSSCRVSLGNDVTSGSISYSQEELKPRAFDKLDINAPCDVYYTQTNGDVNEAKFDFSAIKDAELVGELKEHLKAVYRSNGTLEIGISGRVRGLSSLGKGQRVKVYVTSTDLVSIDNEGVGNVFAKGINSDHFKVVNEGVGSISITSVLANVVKLDNEGVGSIKVENLKGDDLTVINEGVGSVTLGKFVGTKVSLDNEGVGSIHAAVDCESVKAVNEGVGSIHLSGKTHVLTQHNDGVGAIRTSELQVGK